MVNQSSRNRVKPRIIVLHTTEGHNRPGLGDLFSIEQIGFAPAVAITTAARTYPLARVLAMARSMAVT